MPNDSGNWWLATGTFAATFTEDSRDDFYEIHEQMLCMSHEFLNDWPIYYAGESPKFKAMVKAMEDGV